jgi:hypothetical protein
VLRCSCEPVWIEGKGNRIPVRGQNGFQGSSPVCVRPSKRSFSASNAPSRLQA